MVWFVVMLAEVVCAFAARGRGSRRGRGRGCVRGCGLIYYRSRVATVEALSRDGSMEVDVMFCLGMW